MKNLFKIDEDFIKNYNEKNDIGYILEVDVEYLKSLYVICMIKKAMLFI